MSADCERQRTYQMNTLVQRYEERIKCLCEQLQAQQRQLEAIQGEFERCRCRLSSSCQELEEFRTQLNHKDETISCLQNQLEDLKYEFKEKERSAQRLCDALQEKTVKFHEQSQQKEAALLRCRNEISTHMTTLEGLKVTYNCELKKKEKSMIQLEDDLRRVYEDLKCKTDENSQLDKQLVDFKSRLHQCCCKLQEADNNNTTLREKLQHMEVHSAKEKSEAMNELEELKKKIAQSDQQLAAAQNEMRKYNRCLQVKSEECRSLLKEQASVEQQLQKEKELSLMYREQAMNRENDNKEICRLLQQKVKCIKELEQSVCAKEQELKTCRCCVEELSVRVRQLNTDAKSKGELGQLKDQLTAAREKVKGLEEKLEDKTNKLEWAVKEMEILAQEVKRLNCLLEEARADISTKDSVIEDHKTTIERVKQDMEQRMRRVDDQLQHYEVEISEKSKMISDIEDKSCRYRCSLDEKVLEVEQLQQQLKRLNSQNSSVNAQNEQLAQSRDCLQKSCNELKGQCAEMAQELAALKQQVEQKASECTEVKREMAALRKELDKSRDDSEQARTALQNQDSELKQTAEEKNCLASKVVTLQCRLQSDTAQLTQQMSEVKCRLEKEVERLKVCQLELEETNTNLVQKVTAGQRQLVQMEKCCVQKVEALTRENGLLKGKLGDKEDQIQATRDCLTLKDSEIMRLKLRLCSIDRCNSSSSACSDATTTTCGKNADRTGNNWCYLDHHHKCSSASAVTTSCAERHGNAGRVTHCPHNNTLGFGDS